jgi:alkylhydroperoxidase family enzyme
MDIRHAVGVKQGVDAATLAELPCWRDSAAFSARERAALAFCEEIVADDREVSDACFASVREHFSEGDIVELVLVIGYQIFASKFAKAFSLAPQGFSSQASSTPRSNVPA